MLSVNLTPRVTDWTILRMLLLDRRLPTDPLRHYRINPQATGPESLKRQDSFQRDPGAHAPTTNVSATAK